MKVDFSISPGAPDVSYIELTGPETDRRCIVARNIIMRKYEGHDVHLDFDVNGGIVGIELLSFKYRGN
jgi:uncharacterized protein YuzE